MKKMEIGKVYVVSVGEKKIKAKLLEVQKVGGKNLCTVENIKTREVRVVDESVVEVESLGSKLANIDLSKTRPQKMSSQVRKDSRKGAELPHVMVLARAGTGKTWTLMGGLCYAYKDRCPELWAEFVRFCKGVEPVPSPQQLEIWEELRKSADAGATTVRYAAFSKAIVKEFDEKWGWVAKSLAKVGVKLVFSTNHSAGYAALSRHYAESGLLLSLNETKSMDRLWTMMLADHDLAPSDMDVLTVNSADPDSAAKLERRQKMQQLHFRIQGVVIDILNYCRLNLIVLDAEDPDEILDRNEEMRRVALYYGVNLGHLLPEEEEQAFSLVRRLYAEMMRPDLHFVCKDENENDVVQIDYTDMVWLPVVCSLPVAQFDLILGDEFQDLNMAQHSMIEKSGDRIVFVGDDRQAIYGFAAAASDGMAQFARKLSRTDRGLKECKLTTTRRCSKAVVALAKKYVPDFEAHEDNKPGSVHVRQYPQPQQMLATGGERRGLALWAQPGDMILSRSGAPLLPLGLTLGMRGVPFRILGKETIDGQIWSILNKLEANTRSQAIAWVANHVAGLMKPKMSNDEVNRLLQVRQCCTSIILCLPEVDWTVEMAINRAQDIMRGSSLPFHRCVVLATAHKAKGLEAERVFIVNTKEAPIPNPKAQLDWEREQEINIFYVALTRSKDQIVFLTDRGLDDTFNAPLPALGTSQRDYHYNEET